MARFDFPNEWPELLTTLLPLVESTFNNALTEENKAIRYNSLYTLHLSMKALALKALPAAKKTMRDITPNVFLFVHSVFTHRMAFYFDNIQTESVLELDRTLNIARICLKCLRRLIVYGYDNLLDHALPKEFLSNLYQYLPRLVAARASMSPSSQSIYKTLSALCILIGKVYTDVENEKIIQFIHIPGCLNAVKYYWTLLESLPKDSGDWFNVDDPVVEKVTIHGLKLVKNLIKHPQFSLLNQKKEPLVDQALHLLDQVFTTDFVISCAGLLINKFLVLSKEDLESWENDPESFVLEEEADHWEYHPRVDALI